MSCFANFCTKQAVVSTSVHTRMRKVYAIGIKHDFPFINIRKVPREGVKTDVEARGFLPLLLHKFKENMPKTEKMFAHFILQPYHHFLTHARTLFINILDSGRGQVLSLMMILRLSMRFQ